MNNKEKVKKLSLREIPSVDEIIIHFQQLVITIPYALCIKNIRKTLNSIRKEIRQGLIKENIRKYAFRQIEVNLIQASNSNMTSVINGTGIILHTGLGRAPISLELIKKAMDNVYPYTNLEFDLEVGKRGERNDHVIDLINVLTGSEAAVVVNNNAAAVLLMLNTLSEGKEVIISRGEQVEIGGSFRIPDVILKSGCKMLEIGTTNKTHLKDYQDAINSNTGAIMVAHTSNYKVVGFTHSVDLSDLGKLARKKRIPLIVDLGCGALADFQDLSLPEEPTVLSYIKSAAGVYSFSGDKLLGGPQAGIICGKKTLIRKIHQNPLYRSLRCDKFIYSILEQTLMTYITPTKIHKDNLSMLLFQRASDELEKIARKILKKLSPKIIKKYAIEIKKTEVEAGSGSLPVKKISSIAMILKDRIRPSELARKFRLASPSVLGYLSGNYFHIDLKAIPPHQEESLIKVLHDVLI